MRVCIVDHQDSFTYNLVHDLARVSGERPEVIESRRATPQRIGGDGWPDLIVLSAGPGHPCRAADVGASAELLRALPPDVPLFGVCFGLQLLVTQLGGRVVPARRVVHGKSVRIQHGGSGLFRGLDPVVSMMRYNSLVAERASLPADLRVDATEEDGEIMAISHRHRPLWAVQFHPESVGSLDGIRILENLGRLVRGGDAGGEKKPGEVTQPSQESASPGEIAAHA